MSYMILTSAFTPTELGPIKFETQEEAQVALDELNNPHYIIMKANDEQLGN